MVVTVLVMRTPTEGAVIVKKVVSAKVKKEKEVKKKSLKRL